MSVLAEVIARNRAGQGVGLPAWCTAHTETLSAVLATYRDDAAPILIEATCNQVNQDGGYTGMTPAAFRRFVQDLASAQGVAPGRLILGGDHLGPNPWRKLDAVTAMDKARAMVEAYVAAGFGKIHLDASMPCGGEVLAEEQMAERAADLAAVAEAGGQAPLYVIGTEVPVPGGETGGMEGVAVTTAQAAQRTYDLHREAFAARGLSHAMERVVAVVVQPGVDFSNDAILGYDPAKAVALSRAALSLPGPAFEAHSTDYQTEQALTQLVAGHFAILKVGPELTFAYRQAVFALERLARLMGLQSQVEDALLRVMQDDPGEWRAYVSPGPSEGRMMLWGLSDRVRYYWPRPQVREAVAELFATLRQARPEPGLVAQVTGGLAAPVDPVTLPETVIRQMVGAVVSRYRRATGEDDAPKG